jgi:hypothetical protein
LAGRPGGRRRLAVTAGAQVFDELMSTGAVVADRETFEPARGWGGDHHDGIPIFILTHRDPKELTQWPLVTYVNDVAAAITQAKEAASERSALVHGARTAQLALGAGVLDELQRRFDAGCCSARDAGCSRASLPIGNRPRRLAAALATLKQRGAACC